jgi:hypothetical protein
MFAGKTGSLDIVFEGFADFFSFVFGRLATLLVFMV